MSDNMTKKDGVDLKYYIEKLLDEKEKALILQSKELSRRLDALNGEAARLATMQRTYIPREVADTRICSLEDKLDALESWKDRQEGKASQSSVLIAYAISLIGIILGVVGLLR